MLLIIGIHSISVTCCNSIHVIFFLLPTCNIYNDLIVEWQQTLQFVLKATLGLVALFGAHSQTLYNMFDLNYKRLLIFH